MKTFPSCSPFFKKAFGRVLRVGEFERHQEHTQEAKRARFNIE